MKILLIPFLLAAGALASCSDRDFRGEEFSNFYRGPAEATTQERVERREIVHWAKNPRDKKRIGFLWKYETQVAGSRSVRESYYIMNLTGTKREGFVTAEGEFYRFDENGRRGEFVGAYPIQTTGLKVFFGFPLTDSIDLEEIDPHK